MFREGLVPDEEREKLTGGGEIGRRETNLAAEKDR